MLKTEYRLKITTGNATNNIRITEEQADSLIRGVNGNLSDLNDKCAESEKLDGVEIELVKNMFLTAIRFEKP